MEMKSASEKRWTISLLRPGTSSPVKLAVNSSDTVAQVISAYSEQQKVKKPFLLVLRQLDYSMLEPSQSLKSCGVNNGDELVICGKYDESFNSYSSTWFLIAIAVLLGGGCIIAINVLKCMSGTIPDQYGIVIDADTDNTSLYIYKWNGQRNSTGIVEQFADTCISEGGLASFADNLSGIFSLLGKCLNYAALTIPSNRKAFTYLYLGAGSAMHLLKMKDPGASCEIFSSTRDVIKVYNFAFKSASIISGHTQAVDEWISLNYLRKSISSSQNGEISDFLGLLNLGETSASIAFPTSHPSSFSETVELFGKDVDIYGQSFLCFGLNQAMVSFSSIIADPCSPCGSITSYSRKDIFNDLCSLTLRETFEVSEYTFNGTCDQNACSDYLGKLFEDDSCIGKIFQMFSFVKLTLKIDGEKVTWPLGFILNATNTLPTESPIELISSITYILLMVLCCLILISGFNFFLRMIILKSRKKSFSQL
ncbi:unnamed protein product [Soboliphyme baturini]|uniref:Ubiquitin-like domain-containing protein n=1 Tax=Soboliphyme baturini TaxID=241478 RepID=A0A183ILA1_9BILA|nr:unnamed protein product [Soboliphyme baturini]